MKITRRQLRRLIREATWMPPFGTPQPGKSAAERAVDIAGGAIKSTARKVLGSDIAMEPLDRTQVNQQMIDAINATTAKAGWTGQHPMKDAVHSMMMRLTSKGRTLDPDDVDDWVQDNIVMVVRKYQTGRPQDVE